MRSARILAPLLAIVLLYGTACSSDADDAGGGTASTAPTDATTSAPPVETEAPDATTAPPVETEAPDATPATAPVTDPPPPVDQAAVLASLPWASVEDSHQDPVAAAESFVDFVGFVDFQDLDGDGNGEAVAVTADDVEFSQYVAADSRSGEVEFRVQGPDSPATTVIVRQAGPDDYWWVVGSVSEVLTVDNPTFDELWDLGVVGTYHTIGGGGILRVYEEGSSTPLLAACVPCGGGVFAQGEFEYDLSADSTNCEQFSDGSQEITPCDWTPPDGGTGTVIITGGDGVATIPVIFPGT